jgi:hypothetical protein
MTQDRRAQYNCMYSSTCLALSLAARDPYIRRLFDARATTTRTYECTDGQRNPGIASCNTVCGKRYEQTQFSRLQNHACIRRSAPVRPLQPISVAECLFTSTMRTTRAHELKNCCSHTQCNRFDERISTAHRVRLATLTRTKH